MPLPLQLVDPAGQPQQLLSVPLAWAEVTLQQFVAAYAPEPPALEDEDDEPPVAPLLVEAILGTPAGTLAQLSAEQALWLSAKLAFVLDLDQMLGQPLPEGAVPVVGSRSFGALLLAQQQAEAHAGRPWPAYGPYVLALYRMEATWGKVEHAQVKRCLAALLAGPVTESAPACKALLDQLAELAERFRPWESDELDPTDEELDAGSEEFAERFGSMLSLDGAAASRVIDYQKVLELDADTILLKLMMEGARTAYHRRIQRAREAQHASHH